MRLSSLAHLAVTEFHDTFGLPIRDPDDGSTIGTKEERRLRAELIMEEAQEFVDACEFGDLVAMADALADLLYVTYGAAITFGIPLDAVVSEVHRSNMTKLWNREEVGQHCATLPESEVLFVEEFDDAYVAYRFDGKVLKPPSFESPNIIGVLSRKGRE